nr:MAG TPA: hypothetical protein [Caudoviricetes sp.]
MKHQIPFNFLQTPFKNVYKNLCKGLYRLSIKGA